MRPEEEAREPRPGRSWKMMLRDKSGTSSKSHQSLLGKMSLCENQDCPKGPLGWQGPFWVARPE